jgi:hypothetical protein
MMIHLAPINKVRAAALSLISIGVLSCSGEWVTVAANAPLDQIVLSPSGEASVHARPEVGLQELVFIRPFLEAGLRPGMTAEEAEAVLGAPDYIATERNGQDEVFGYESSAGAFEIVKQSVSSEGSEVDRWFLRHQPQDCMRMINPLILQQLRALERFPRQMRLLVGPDQIGLVSIEFEDEQSCSRIWWLGESPQ